MTPVLTGKDLVLEGSTTKIEDKQVPGIYTWTWTTPPNQALIQPPFPTPSSAPRSCSFSKREAERYSEEFMTSKTSKHREKREGNDPTMIPYAE